MLKSSEWIFFARKKLTGKSLETCEILVNFAHQKAFQIVSVFRKRDLTWFGDKSFANFLREVKSLIIRGFREMEPVKTQHLTMKKQGICEIHVCEMAKSCKINVLGFVETSDLCQMTSSKYFKQDCCRSLSFG